MATIDELIRKIAREEARRIMRGSSRSSLDSFTGNDEEHAPAGEMATRCPVCDRVFSSAHGVRIHQGRSECGLPL